MRPQSITHDDMWKDDYMNLDVYSQDILNSLENIFNKEIKEGKDTGTFQRERDR